MRHYRAVIMTGNNPNSSGKRDPHIICKGLTVTDFLRNCKCRFNRIIQSCQYLSNLGKKAHISFTMISLACLLHPDSSHDQIYSIYSIAIYSELRPEGWAPPSKTSIDIHNLSYDIK